MTQKLCYLSCNNSCGISKVIDTFAYLQHFKLKCIKRDDKVKATVLKIDKAEGQFK